MSWEELAGVTKPVGGMLRSSAVMEDLRDRGEHLFDTYRPVVGGISPGSYLKTQAGAWTTYARPLIPPLDCDVELQIYCGEVGTAIWQVRWTVDGNTDVVVASAPGWITLGPLTAPGTAHQTLVEVKRTAGGGGDWVELHGGIIRPVADDTGLTIALPEAGAFASGEPHTPDYVRRLSGSATDIAKVRRPALQWFASNHPRTSSLTHTFDYAFPRGLFLDARAAALSQSESGWELGLAFTAAVTTFAQFISTGGTFHVAAAGLGVVAVKEITWPQRDFGGFKFVDNTGAPAPVEAFVLYEDF